MLLAKEKHLNSTADICESKKPKQIRRISGKFKPHLSQDRFLTMFFSAVKVQNYRRLLQMHETTPSNFRNDAIGLDQRVQRKLFETSSVQTLKKKRNFGEMMTTHRYKDILEPNYTPRTTRSERKMVYLPLREEICAAKRIDTDLCSSNLVFGAPEEGDEEALQEFRDVMQGEIQAGQLVEISTAEVLSTTKDPPA